MGRNLGMWESMVCMGFSAHPAGPAFRKNNTSLFHTGDDAKRPEIGFLVVWRRRRCEKDLCYFSGKPAGSAVQKSL